MSKLSAWTSLFSLTLHLSANCERPYRNTQKPQFVILTNVILLYTGGIFMIIKLTLDSEQPELLIKYLKKTDCLRSYPNLTPINALSDQECADLYKKDKHWRHILKTYEINDDDDIPFIQPDDMRWMTDAIETSFGKFLLSLFPTDTAFADYHRQCFSVELLQTTHGCNENGKSVLVFPNSYTNLCYLQF